MEIDNIISVWTFSNAVPTKSLPSVLETYAISKTAMQSTKTTSSTKTSNIMNQNSGYHNRKCQVSSQWRMITPSVISPSASPLAVLQNIWCLKTSRSLDLRVKRFVEQATTTYDSDPTSCVKIMHAVGSVRWFMFKVLWEVPTFNWIPWSIFL